MAGQRNRVWIARLAAGLLVVGGLVGIAGYMAWRGAPSAPPPILAQPTSIDPKLEPSPKVSTSRPPHPLDEVLTLARDALANHQARDRDFTALLVKRERVGGKLQPEARMEIKLRYNQGTVMEPAPEFHERTTSVYLKFTSPKAQAGREAIWRQGENDDKLVVHESGMLNLVRAELAPRSRLAMIGNRYPISDIGIERLLTRLIEKGERDRELGQCVVTTTEGEPVGDRPCRLIEVKHPERTGSIDGKAFSHEFYLARIYIDVDRMLPLKYAAYLWPEQPGDEPVLEEEYTYLDLKLNVGLESKDFDPNNRAYNYPW